MGGVFAKMMLVLLAAFLGVATTACGESSATDDDGSLLIVATTTILGDVARNIATDKAEVQVLIDPGLDPHAFQPSPRDAAALREADLVLVNGLGLEEGLLDVVEAAADDGATILELAPALDPIPLRGDGDTLDPHFWMDPLRMADATTIIGERMGAIDRGRATAWREAAAAYRTELLATHDEITRKLAVLGDRPPLVTNHDALGYFAARYGFEVIGTVISGGTSLSEPSAADMADLVALIDTTDRTAIFVEATQPTDVADAVASALARDVPVVALYTSSLADTADGPRTYIELLRKNADRIVEALT